MVKQTAIVITLADRSQVLVRIDGLFVAEETITVDARHEIGARWLPALIRPEVRHEHG